MRKFTTQTLSLLTALSFAGALSAQTVEDAIATADNATGGNKLGLTVEGYFMYGLLGGNGAQNYSGLKAEDLFSETATLNYKFYGASAIGGGANIGYQIAENLDVIAGIKIGAYSAPDVTATASAGAYAAALPIFLLNKSEYNEIKNVATAIGQVAVGGNAAIQAASLGTAEILGQGMNCLATAQSASCNNDADAADMATFWRNNMSAGTLALQSMWLGATDALGTSNFTLTGGATTRTGTYSGTLETSFTTMVVNLGLRPKVKAWGGEVYAGAGLNIALPTEITQTVTLTGAEALSYNKAVYTRKFGASIAGLYGELGYNYDVMPNLYVGGGVKLNFNVPNNVGETATIVYSKDGTTVTSLTTTKSESHTTASESLTGSGTDYTNKAEADAFGMTDIQVQLNVGYRL